MKKIFRFAMVFALAGATLLYSGCTKDYEKDIESVKADLKELQEGTIADQQAQIEKLSGQVGQLETLTSNLQTAVNNINTAIEGIRSDVSKKADKTELESVKNALNAQISNINDAIESIKTTLSQKADKSWVEQTFATKAALEQVSNTLGSLQSTVSGINTRLGALTTRVDGIETTLGEVKTTATTAYNDAKNALGQIENIWKNFDNYYKKGEIDAFLANYYTKTETDDEIAKAKEVLRGELKSKAEELQGNIDKVSKALDDEIAARIQADNDEIAARQKAVQDLQDYVDAKLAEIDGKILELAGRVNSLSVVPTKSPEIIKVKLGDQQANLLLATVVVEPKIWAGKIEADDLKVYVEEALPRTKGVGASLPVRILAADENAGTITVLVKDVEDLEDAQSNAYFFAFEYTGSDKAGDFTVRSEYAQAVDTDFEFDFGRNISWRRTTEDGEEEVEGEVVLDKANIDYTVAGEYTDTPFAGFAPKFYVGENMGDEYVTVDELNEMTGLTVTYNTDVTVTTEGEFEADEACVQISQEGFAAQTTCESEDFSLQVGEQTTGTYAVEINGAAAGLTLIKEYEIVPHIVCDKEEVAELYVPWNYQNWDLGEGELLKEDVGGHWEDAIEDGAKAKAEATITPDAEFVFGDWVADDEPTAASEAGDYPDNLTVAEASFEADEQNFEAFIEKQNTFNYYSFIVPIRVAAAMADKTIEMDGDEEAFTITGKNTLTVGEAVDKALQDEDGNIDAKYFDGIADPDEDDLREAFLGGQFLSVTVNGEEIALAGADEEEGDEEEEETTGVSVEMTEDGIVATFPAKTFAYDKEYTVEFVYEAFGVRYTYVYTFKTAAAPFELVTTPYVKKSIASPFTYNGKNAEARGSLANDTRTYTIEDMYFAKYYRVDGDLSAEEDGAAEVVFDWEECTEIYGPAGKGTTITGDTSAAVSAGEGAYVLDPEKKLTWGGFTGRCFILKAQLQVAGVSVGREVSFLMWTRRPVEFEEGEIVIRANRMPAEDKTFNMDEELSVYGVVNGVLDKNFNVLVGTPKRNYPGMEITYLFDKMKTTINGEEYILEKNVDYLWSANQPGIVTIIGDNVVGSVTVELQVELRNQLDYGHLYDNYTDPSEIFLFGGVQRKTVKLELNQK